ncbi:hypothetical protein HFO45_31210 [Rhizobium leguminosarum]|uniref:hypothetical protein n=1 Tax=Rhizobium leguminosarum TaxID=384 RepID=UPI001C97F21B|nr:hypothetical protein [Rhizobium leguminosarum]MBY5652648.1 hypothetical protein [Rhizobium leguminosarum]
MTSTWATIIGATGIGGVGCFVIWSLYKQWLALPIFRRISSTQTFVIMIIFLMLVFATAIFGIYSGLSSNLYNVGTKSPDISTADLFIRRTPESKLFKYSLVANSVTQSVEHIPPLAEKDSFRISVSFVTAMSVAVVWQDTVGKATTVFSDDTIVSQLDYPTNKLITAAVEDPTGYEALLVLKRQNSSSLDKQGLEDALAGLKPPLKLLSPEDDTRGPGAYSEAPYSSFLGFEEMVRKKLPGELKLLLVIYVPIERKPVSTTS